MVRPVSPVLTALWEEVNLPAAVLGPQDFSALARLAASCAAETVDEGDAAEVVDAGESACIYGFDEAERQKWAAT